MGSMDVAEFIARRDAKLDPARLAIKYLAMRKSALAFFRATCALFYARLPKLGRLRLAPPAWSCGDLHLENFGSYRAANGLVYFDLNDFDEALLAPCVFDVLRATASIAIARKTLGQSTSSDADLMRIYVSAYADALQQGHVSWIERDEATGPIGKLVAGLKGKSRSQLLEKRTTRTGKTRKILIDGDHALEAAESEKARVVRLIGHWAQKYDPAKYDRQFYDVADVALRIAGLGSLGLERYVVLIRGEGGVNDMRLLDLKRARASAALPAVSIPQPDWSCEAERVEWVQIRMQARSPADLSTIVDRNRSYVLRELQPREDRLDLSAVSTQPEGLETAMEGFGHLTAWGQLRAAGRSGAANADALTAFGGKPKWQERLIESAADCANRCDDDWQSFCQAYDKGVFRLGSLGQS